MSRLYADDPNRSQMANQIDQAIAVQESLRDELIRVVRPSR